MRISGVNDVPGSSSRLLPAVIVILLALEVALSACSFSQSDLRTVLAEADAAERRGEMKEAVRILDAYVEENPRDASGYLFRGGARFKSGDIEGSVVDFDKVIELDPQAEPQLWQRGIAYYYLARYDDCVAQFDFHRTVNPNDVENPVWHFLCNLRRLGDLEKAQAEILPVGRDPRVPMKQIYDLFRGEATVEDVRAQATPEAPAPDRFYAHLYLALWYEALEQPEASLEELEKAVAVDLPGYMPQVAKVHLELRRGDRP